MSINALQRRPAGQSAFAQKLRRDRSGGSDNLSATLAADRAFPAAVAGRQLKMNPTLTIFALLLWTQVAFGQAIGDPGRIDVYIAPFYNSTSPAIDVGSASKGLGAQSESEFLETISKMKRGWNQLTFPEMYVAAIRLYDRGFRNEAVYWFYSANYRGKLVAALLDPQNLGSIGDPGFELKQAQNAFHQLVGPYINGYAFGDVDRLFTVIEKVQKEGKTIPDLNNIYPGLAFKKKSEWEMVNKEVNEGLAKLAKTINEQRASIKQQRAQNGTEARFSKLTSKELTKGSSQ